MSALVDQGATNLATISNSVNRDIATLVEAGRIRKVYCAFTAPTHPSRDTPFVRMYNNDEIEAELVPQGTLAERIRAAGAGIGAFYTPTSVGTELAEGKEHREINGRMHVLEYPLPADYALIRAWRADTFGNLQFRYAQRNFNPIMAMAGKVTVRRSGARDCRGRGHRPGLRPRAGRLRRPHREDSPRWNLRLGEIHD